MSQAVDTRIIKKFRHRVQVCRGEDVVVNGNLSFEKKFVYDGWAMIVPRRASTFSPNGHTVFEEKDRRTHFIKMRYNPNVEITTAAWIYEARLKSPPRWFKILFVSDEFENSQFFNFECRLMEAGDDITEPGTQPQTIPGIPAGMVL